MNPLFINDNSNALPCFLGLLFGIHTTFLAESYDHNISSCFGIVKGKNPSNRKALKIVKRKLHKASLFFEMKRAEVNFSNLEWKQVSRCFTFLNFLSVFSNVKAFSFVSKFYAITVKKRPKFLGTIFFTNQEWASDTDAKRLSVGGGTILRNQRN